MSNKIISGCRRVALHCALKFAKKKKRNEATQCFVYFAKRFPKGTLRFSFFFFASKLLEHINLKLLTTEIITVRKFV